MIFRFEIKKASVDVSIKKYTVAQDVDTSQSIRMRHADDVRLVCEKRESVWLKMTL